MQYKIFFLFFLFLFETACAVSGDFLYSFGSGMLETPKRIAISSEGTIYISDDIGLIRVLDSYGNLISSFGGGILEYPRGVALLGKLVYVLDKETIRVFDTEGNYLFHFGNEWLKGGSHVAVSSDERIFVTDIIRNAIFIFSKSGQFLSSFPTEMGVNYGIAISPAGLIHILSQQMNNSFISIFDLGGMKISSFLVEEDPLFTPRGITLSQEGHILTTFFNHKENVSKIRVFDSAGNMLKEFGNEHIKIARDITLSAQGLVYVVDSQAEKVCVFR